jgi:hypothetical protein
VLVLEHCTLPCACEAFAAIAALPQLQQLRFNVTDDKRDDNQMFPQFQHPLKLTNLSMQLQGYRSAEAEVLHHLSALVNLQHLDLSGCPSTGCPGGCPSQLAQLTCLRISYEDVEFDVEQQFQHLSCLTALQQLAISCSLQTGLRSIPGIEHLTQLTSLDLKAHSFDFSTRITHSWACRAALQSLTLQDCVVQPEALAAFTQLRVLCLGSVKTPGTASLEELLLAVSQLPLLTDVVWGSFDSFEGSQLAAYPSAAAFTALTASTNLCSLQLHSDAVMTGQFLPALFQPGPLYPQLRAIELDFDRQAGMAITEQQLHLLCNCCPAVESLVFVPGASLSCAPATAWDPLLQLSALTRLGVHYVRSYSGSAAAVSTVAQLTRLKELSMELRLDKHQQNVPLQLAALTALVKLDLKCTGAARSCQLTNKVRGHQEQQPHPMSINHTAVTVVVMQSGTAKAHAMHT